MLRVVIFLLFFVFCQAGHAGLISRDDAPIKHLSPKETVTNTFHFDLDRDKQCEAWQNRLVLVKFPIVTMEGKNRSATVLVLDAVAPAVKKIFNELYNIRFPISPVGLDNKTGLFSVEGYNCKKTSSVSASVGSLYRYGTAIGINPEENPAILINMKSGKLKVYPRTKKALLHINRRVNRPDKPFRYGMVDTQVITIFRNAGFNIWGGNWDELIDHHHFQISDEFAELLLAMTLEDGRRLFDYHVNYLQLPSRRSTIQLNHGKLYHTKEYTIRNDDLIFDVLQGISGQTVANMEPIEVLIRLYKNNNTLFWQKIMEAMNRKQAESERYN